MCSWTRQPQERPGTYLFAGQLYTTRGISAELLLDEILFIYWDVKTFAETNGGADYLQVYINRHGQKIFVVDQLSQEQIESSEFEREDDYLTILFASEY